MVYALWVEQDNRFAFSDSDNGGLEVADSYHTDLMGGQSQGLQIVRGADGFPCLVEPVPARLNREQIEERRLLAYADPITGSDRLFIDYQRELTLGNAQAAESAKKAWMDRAEQIKRENSYE